MAGSYLSCYLILVLSYFCKGRGKLGFDGAIKHTYKCSWVWLHICFLSKHEYICQNFILSLDAKKPCDWLWPSMQPCILVMYDVYRN
jgi:hypothetical protein